MPTPESNLIKSAESALTGLRKEQVAIKEISNVSTATAVGSVFIIIPKHQQG
jgi:hypothetical protein